VNNLKLAIVLSSMIGGVAPSVFAGAGTLTASMVPLSDNVSYSIASPALQTYVAFTITVTNSGRNTINHIAFTVNARATDSAEHVVLLDAAQNLPANCSRNAADASEFTCTVRQLKSGAASDAFTVFYQAPAKNQDGHFDLPNSDFVDLHMRILYAEQLGGVPQSRPQNSIVEFDTATASPRGSVTLGTANADLIRSGVPKSGATLYTGAGGKPTTTNRSAMLVGIPATGSITTAQLQITRELDSDQGECLNQGHFRECPSYAVTVPGAFAPTAPLTTTYRIDASSLKLYRTQILTSVLIRYTGDTFVDVPVNACVNGAPTPNGIPCVLSSRCYPSDAQPADLAGDCEWELINTKNGFTKFF